LTDAPDADPKSTEGGQTLQSARKSRRSGRPLAVDLGQSLAAMCAVWLRAPNRCLCAGRTGGFGAVSSGERMSFQGRKLPAS